MNIGKTTLANLIRKHRVDLLTLLGCVLLAVGVNWVAFQAISSDQAMLNILSLDEWAYTDFLNWAFYAALSPFDPTLIAALHDPFGYGSIFWYLYGAVGVIPHFFGSFTAEILTYRIFSAVWLGVSMWLLYKIVYLMRGQYWPARFAALVVLVLPGFYFYDKPFSAEFLHLALCLGTLYSFLVYLQTHNRRWCYWAAVLFGIAIGLKVSAIVFLPIIAIGFIWQERTTQLLQAVKVLSYSAAFTALGFFIANPYILLMRRAGANIYLSAIRQNLVSNATNHGGSTVGLGFQAWLTSVVVPIFFPVWYLILIGLAALVLIYQQRRQAKFIFVILGAGVLYVGYIMLSVKKLWAWYLFPGLSLLGILPMLIDYTKFKLSKLPYVIIWYSVIIIALLAFNFQNIQSRYAEFMQREAQPTFQAKRTANTQFTDWLATQTYANITILKSPYIYFDVTPFADRNLAVATIWGNLTATYITGYQPTILLIEKNYGFTASDAVVGSWSSFPGIQDERIFFSTLITTGFDDQGTHYHYSQIYETDDFIVYERD